MDASNGVDELCQKDMLRLDSMVMMCQLNVRKLLEDNDLPTINIICQKVTLLTFDVQISFSLLQAAHLPACAAVCSYA